MICAYEWFSRRMTTSGPGCEVAGDSEGAAAAAWDFGELI
jgi:hypothetical protein